MTRARIILAGSIVGLVGTAILWGKSTPPEPAKAGIEIEVYEAVLQQWFERTNSNVLVAGQLNSAPELADQEIADCLEGVKFGMGRLGKLTSLRGATFKHKGVRVVDGAAWRADDEQLRSATAQGKVQEADLQRAFDHALTRFSQIRFDQDERLALVSFSFVCGQLCGSGSTFVIKRDGNGWRVMKACRQWIS